MSFQKLLDRYMNDLQEFDLETFFHDDTFVDMLEYRKFLEENTKQLNTKEAQELLYLDEIVVSYYNLYKSRDLTGYQKFSFKVGCRKTVFFTVFWILVFDYKNTSQSIIYWYFERISSNPKTGNQKYNKNAIFRQPSLKQV